MADLAGVLGVRTGGHVTCAICLTAVTHAVRTDLALVPTFGVPVDELRKQPAVPISAHTGAYFGAAVYSFASRCTLAMLDVCTCIVRIGASDQTSVLEQIGKALASAGLDSQLISY
jgi:hypothetical protein